MDAVYDIYTGIPKRVRYDEEGSLSLTVTLNSFQGLTRNMVGL